MNILSKINLSIFDKAINKINSEWKSPELNLKQFMLDTLAGNYKVDKKTKQNFVIYIGLLVIPIEDIIGAVAPRLKVIYSFISTPLDEAAIIGKIIMMINEELIKYTKFVNSKNYKQSEFSDIKAFDISLEAIFEQLKTVIKPNPIINETSAGIVTNDMHKIYEPQIYFQYTNEDYKYVIIEYLIANNGEAAPVKIDYKDISKNVIFKQGFDIASCERIVQNEMSHIIDKKGIEQLHTYRLSHPMYIEHNYLLSKNKVRNESIIDSSNIKYIENNVIIEYHQPITVELIAKLINAVENLSTEAIDNISVIINNDIIIGFNLDSTIKVQAISKNIECLKLAQVIEQELRATFTQSKIKVSKVSLPKLTKQSLTKKKINDSDITKLAIDAFCNRILSNQENQEIEIKISDLRYFIPFYDKNNLTNYLHLLEASESCIRVSEKVIVMKSNKIKYSINPESVSFETLFYKRDCFGNYDYKHLIEITQINYVIQSIYNECPALDVNMFITCGNSIYIGVHIGKKPQVKIIDMEMKLGKTKHNIEKQLNDELKQNSRALDILYKS